MTKVALRKINVYIEELVLDGFKPGDKYGIADALQGELAALLAERGLPSSGLKSARVDDLKAGPIVVAPRDRADKVGKRAARSVYRGLTR